MARANQESVESFSAKIQADNPFRPGTLVRPRLGYFHPEVDLKEQGSKFNYNNPHPVGIILGAALMENYLGREFYRVRFGSTTYERVHPIQMEIINEV